MPIKFIALFLLPFTFLFSDLPLYYWKEKDYINFGDYLSLIIVERMIEGPVRVYKNGTKEKKFLAIGSILSFARTNDVVWGSGINGKLLDKSHYLFTKLDVRSVRGPKTRAFLKDLGIHAPAIYGDPALLMPHLFPEFKRKEPKYPFLIVLHYSDVMAFTKKNDYVVYATDPWDEVVNKILESEFVISSSLHGVIVAEAFGIPAKLLRLSEKEPDFKFEDYYLGSGRDSFSFAKTVEEALQQGGEPPPQVDLEKLYQAFPFDLYKPIKQAISP